MTSSAAIAEAESRWWLMPGRQIEVGLMQCGINMWPTVSVCGRLWVQMQTPEARWKCQSIAPQSKVVETTQAHIRSAVWMLSCSATHRHTRSTDHFYLPKEQKQKVILRLFRIFPFLTFNFSGLLQSFNFFRENLDLKRRSSPPAGPLKVKTAWSKVSIVCTLW